VYFGTTTSPSKVANVLASSYAPALQPGTKYYWRIVARNSTGTASGPVWSFTTVTATGLPTVGSPSPANGALNWPSTNKLSWQGSGATAYDFYFGTTPTPTFRSTVTVASYGPDMKPAMKYYWQVVARNAKGSTKSPVWSFTTASSSTASPVDCVLSAWSLKSAGQWSTCSSGVQTRTEEWIRTIVVAPQNGGKACGPLSETRTATQSCSVQPTSLSGLLTKADLVYEGAFRVPTGTGTATYGYGGTALTYHPGHNSLMLVGHDWYQRVGEISIPTPGKGTSVSDLPRATTIQPPTDVLAGKLTTIDGDTTNGVKVGGLLPVGNSMLVSAWSYYDAGSQKQTKTHFKTGQNFSALGTVSGPFQVGIGFQDIVPTDTQRIGGFVSGYMSTIPSAWQSALGGTHLTGQGGGVSILGRTSSGPSATVFTPAEVGVPNSPTKLVMGYPSNSSNPSDPLHHPTLGLWGVNGNLYNGTQSFRGMVFPDGTRSVLFFGWGGSRFCYGAGTADPTLDGKPNPQGGIWCYDPVNLSKGTHGYPNTSIVWAYDANDFLAVKQGTKKSWEVVPYAEWNFQVPFQSRLVNGVEMGIPNIVGAAYDPAGKRIFISAYRNDGDAPLIHVFRLP
jgi:hypothetical protein